MTSQEVRRVLELTRDLAASGALQAPPPLVLCASPGWTCVHLTVICPVGPLLVRTRAWLLADPRGRHLCLGGERLCNGARVYLTEPN
jgi:hypothetical protein